MLMTHSRRRNSNKELAGFLFRGEQRENRRGRDEAPAFAEP